MRWYFNRARQFHQLKSLGLKKALRRFKGITSAQLPIAAFGFAQLLGDKSRFLSLSLDPPKELAVLQQTNNTLLLFTF